MKNRRVIISKIISIAFSAFIFLMVLELCTRIDDSIKYGAPFFTEYKNSRLRSFDEDGLRYNLPNTKFEKWTNNKHGFRGPVYDIDKPDGIIRVVCLGTSETYGSFESPGKEWPAQLSDFLKQNNSYEVINASAVGLGMQRYTEYMEKHVFKFDPDIVILFINPQLEMAELIYHPDGTPAPKNKLAKSTKASSFSLGSIKKNFRIFTKTWQMIKNFMPQWILETYQHRDRVKKIKQMELKYLKGEQPLDTIPLEIMNSFKRYLENIVIDLKNQDIKVILAAYPCLISKENIDSYPLIFMEYRRFCIFLSDLGMANASEVADSLSRSLADEYEAGFVDCNSLIPKNTTHYGDNVHLFDVGSEIVAKALAEYIETNYIEY